MSAILPSPRTPIAIRPALASDLAFIDQLQSKHTKMVGWMPTKQLEGKIAAGNVLIADVGARPASPSAEEGDAGSPPAMREPAPTGYIIAQDQYFKHDDVGIIYQLNVLPTAHRKLIGATLIKAVFDRAAYGCKLFCCWCAQDIDANHFWESLGFIPLAFRSGSRGKGRTHIFWQRRIREGDVTTPYWFPAQTSAGSIREDRLVLPIPPGTHWSDAKPVVLPQQRGLGVSPEHSSGASLALPSAAGRRKCSGAGSRTAGGDPKPRIARLGGVSFTPPAPPKPPKTKKPRAPKLKNDPAHVAAARELRDRYLEHICDHPLLSACQSKYDVSRLGQVELTHDVYAECKLLG